MKRIISILLSVLIVFTSFSGSLSAYAFECEHDWFEVKTIAPTCNTEGYTLNACRICSVEEKTNIQNTTDEHDFLNGKCLKCNLIDTDYKIEPRVIALNEDVTFVTTKGREYTYSSFTPAEDGFYDIITPSEKVLSLEAVDTSTNTIIKTYGRLSGMFNCNYIECVKLSKDVNYRFKVYYNSSKNYGDVNYKIVNHEHKYGKNTSQVSNCTTEGLCTYKCTYCGDSYQVTTPVDLNNHNMTFENGPVCKRCNNVYCVDELVCGNDNILPQASKNTYKYYSFVPENDGMYSVYSKCISSAFLIYLLDEDFNVIDDKFYQKNKGNSGYPSYASTTITYNEFVSGKTYYIGVFYREAVTDDENIFGVREHTHDIYVKSEQFATCSKDGYKIYKCRGCEYTRTDDIVPATDNHNYVDGVCETCSKKNPDEIQHAYLNIGEKETITAKSSKGGMIRFHFTPAEEGYYTFITEKDNSSILFVRNGVALTTTDSILFLNANEEYYLDIYNIKTGENVSLTVLNHEHEFYVDSYTPPSCRNNGTVGYRCNICRCTNTESIEHEDGVHYYFNGVCRCGKKEPDYNRVTGSIELGESITFKEQYRGTKFTYSFVAPESDYYVFTARIIDSAYGMSFIVYDKDFKSIGGGSGRYRKNSVIVRMNKGDVVYVEFRSDHNTTNTISVETHIHNINDTVIAPTCNELGYTKHTCTECKFYTIDSYTEATGEHIFEQSIVNPTCSTPGYTEMECKNCGVGYIFDYVSEDSSCHKYVYDVCEDCGKISNDVVPDPIGVGDKIAVEFKSSKDRKWFSFTPDETDYYTFSTGYTGDDDVILDLFAFGEPSYYCDGNYACLIALLEKGQTYYILLSEYTLIKEFTLSLTKHTHNYVKSGTVKPTCTDYGYSGYMCACGANRYMNYTKPTGIHSWVKDEVVAPTCADYGYTLYYCDYCYETKEENIVPATDSHTYENNICKECGKREFEPEIIDCGAIADGDVQKAEYTEKNKQLSYIFTPAESATYIFSSTGTVDTYAKLYDENGKLLNEDDDSALAYNFQIVYDCEAGKTYQLVVEPLDFETWSFNVCVNKHTHDFAELVIPASCGNNGGTISTCKTCFEVVETNTTDPTNEHKFNELGVCTECGCFVNDNDNFNEIKLNEKNTVEEKQEGLFKFVPEYDLKYKIFSEGDLDPIGIILDNNGEVLDFDYGSGLGNNFSITIDLKANHLYYIITDAMVDNYTVTITTDHVHDYETIYEKVPTCNENGNYIKQCKICSFNEIVTTKATGHSYVQTDTHYPTCTEDGYIEKVCKDCGQIAKTYTNDLKAKGHCYNKYGTYFPTCTEDGYNFKTCSNCGYTVITYTDDLKSKGHSYYHYYDEPTSCVEEGYSIYKCSKCGDEYRDNIIPQKQHEFYIEKVEPTCKSKGYKIRRCKNCFYECKYDYTPVSDHLYIETWNRASTSKDGKIEKKCQYCDKVISRVPVYQIKTISLSSTSYYYDGKVKTPTVVIKDRKGNTLTMNRDYTLSYSSGRKYPGKYDIKITFNGRFYGTVTKSFYIKPKGTSLTNLTATSKGFKVYWKKQSTQTSGFQIQYATDSKFTQNCKGVFASGGTTTYKSIGKLYGNKRYYVRIRSYKTVKYGGRNINIYSGWSKPMYVTTKK